MCLLTVLQQVAGEQGLSCRSPLAMPGVGEAAFLLVSRDLVCLEQNK